MTTEKYTGFSLNNLKEKENEKEIKVSKKKMTKYALNTSWLKNIQLYEYKVIKEKIDELNDEEFKLLIDKSIYGKHLIPLLVNDNSIDALDYILSKCVNLGISLDKDTVGISNKDYILDVYNHKGTINLPIYLNALLSNNLRAVKILEKYNLNNFPELKNKGQIYKEFYFNYEKATNHIKSFNKDELIFILLLSKEYNITKPKQKIRSNLIKVGNLNISNLNESLKNNEELKKIFSIDSTILFLSDDALKIDSNYISLVNTIFSINDISNRYLLLRLGISKIVGNLSKLTNCDNYITEGENIYNIIRQKSLYNASEEEYVWREINRFDSLKEKQLLIDKIEDTNINQKTKKNIIKI